MASCSKWHRDLTNGVGRCSVPMWRMGMPAGFCDEPAYGERPEPDYYWHDNTGRRRRSDNKYEGYVPSLACPCHGGPRPESVLNLCEFCERELATYQSNPKFGCGKGNDNVYECDEYTVRQESKELQPASHNKPQ